MPDWSPSWWDAALTTCVATLVVANSIAGLATPRVSLLATVFGLISAALLLARSRCPLAALLTIAVCAVLPTLVAGTYPDFYGSFIPTLAAIYAVAVRCSVRQAAAVPVLGVAVLVV